MKNLFDKSYQVNISFENPNVFVRGHLGNLVVSSEVYKWIRQHTDEWGTSNWYITEQDSGGIGYLALGKKFHFPTKQLAMHFKLVWS